MSTVAVTKAYRRNRTFDDENVEDAHAGSPEDIAAQTLTDDARVYTGQNPGGGQGRASEIQGAGGPSMSETATASRHGMSVPEYRAWQAKKWQMSAGNFPMEHIQGHPDVKLPTTAEGLGNMPPPLTTTMGADGDMPLPEEMGNFRRPIIRRAFGYAMDMLESRYFG